MTKHKHFHYLHLSALHHSNPNTMVKRFSFYTLSDTIVFFSETIELRYCKQSLVCDIHYSFSTYYYQFYTSDVWPHSFRA